MKPLDSSGEDASYASLSSRQGCILLTKMWRVHTYLPSRIYLHPADQLEPQCERIPVGDLDRAVLHDSVRRNMKPRQAGTAVQLCRLTRDSGGIHSPHQYCPLPFTSSVKILLTKGLYQLSENILYFGPGIARPGTYLYACITNEVTGPVAQSESVLQQNIHPQVGCSSLPANGIDFFLLYIRVREYVMTPSKELNCGSFLMSLADEENPFRQACTSFVFAKGVCIPLAKLWTTDQSSFPGLKYPHREGTGRYTPTPRQTQLSSSNSHPCRWAVGGHTSSMDWPNSASNTRGATRWRDVFLRSLVQIKIA
ncbi:hypothetical protein PGTUg99_018905 [Puccinia graminis f. sp. tritici]|uniref:Uncharacterized protein n=1 Tax=Puccinia graminis f. sp. tritici TaxID=56615 RepID=A0A5B0SLG0_PUCGR|nr:hypothetical protein PGTUg99_018905 [Puccinia graminis f. sp. tritici]